MSSKKAEARERIKAMREEQARQEKRRERMMRYGVAVAVVAAVAIIAVAVAASRGGSDGPVAVPDAVGSGNGQVIEGDGGGILVGEADAPVTIDYWMDFLCPHCAEFEAANSTAIQELVDSGQANIVYHPLDFTGAVYSRRANNAFACAAQEGQAVEFKSAAFAASTQWSTSSLVDLGEQVGIGGDYEGCVRDDEFEDWAAAVPESARDHEITGTPTVFVNGELLDSTQWTPEGINAAVATVAAGGSLATPAPDATGTAPATPPAGETPNPSATQ
ncbi:disulfide bond formation protein DsbA [Jiangella aurantiaca]|uniref:Disulfide bond formation protein DsbA n=1 Tax=Jiangella aurantiaca TaxID=2530373 RepID=A0A4R5ABE8_9ACTN|nr:thioredoxin domain-containing protein [Jiangella aurantiaca]TDD69683.1 disulfide bond formation protein DsbA [Jiangella aurantiaca]